MKKTSQTTIDEASEHYYFSDQQKGIDNKFRERMIRRCMKHVVFPEILELGFIDGQWTDHFLAGGGRVTVVEGARRMVEFGQGKYRNENRVSIIHSLFEDYEPNRTFDTILMGGMLKHLPDPVSLLKTSRNWLNPGGVLIATTPNPNSLHRRVGTYMGILKAPSDLSEADRIVANMRHYDRYEFRNLLQGGGYEVLELRTSMLKVVSNDKMGSWEDDLLDALDLIADELDDYGWYIYAICSPRL